MSKKKVNGNGFVADIETPDPPGPERKPIFAPDALKAMRQLPFMLKQVVLSEIITQYHQYVFGAEAVAQVLCVFRETGPEKNIGILESAPPDDAMTDEMRSSAASQLFVDALAKLAQHGFQKPNEPCATCGKVHII